MGEMNVFSADVLCLVDLRTLCVCMSRFGKQMMCREEFLEEKRVNRVSLCP